MPNRANRVTDIYRRAQPTSPAAQNRSGLQGAARNTPPTPVLDRPQPTSVGGSQSRRPSATQAVSQPPSPVSQSTGAANPDQQVRYNPQTNTYSNTASAIGRAVTPETSRGTVNTISSEAFVNPDPVYRARKELGLTRGGGGGPTFNIPRQNKFAEERQSIINQIEHGLSTNTPGQRLTVGGLQALTGRLNEIDSITQQGIESERDANVDLAGERFANQRSAARDATTLARQQLANEGAIAQEQASGRPDYYQARTASVRDALNTRETPLQPLPVPDEILSQLDPNTAQQLVQERQTALSNASVLVQQTGSLANALEEANTLVQEALDTEDPESYRRFSLLQQTLANSLAGGYESAAQDVGGRGYAEGGLVSTAGPAGQPPAGPANPVAQLQNYQKYVEVAKRMGVEPMGLEEFMQIGSVPESGPELQNAPATPQGIMGFAQGGMVPDPNQVDGKMVVDPSPTAPTDSIPAMVDGQQPAKLDSGEFVMPDDVVRYYGTAKLDQMIAKAREEMGGSAINGAV